MKASKPVLILLLLVFYFPAASQKYSRVKIYAPTDNMERASLIGLLDIDHFQPVEGGAIIAEIGAKDIARLKRSGYGYRILEDDVAASLEKENKKYYDARAAGAEGRLAFEQTGGTVASIIPTPTTFEVKPTFGGYYSFAEMNTAMNNLVAAYPALVQKTSIGTSYEGRNLWCIKISDNVATDESTEPEVLFLGVQHAREAIGGSSLIFFMQYLCENYASDSRVKALVDNREIFIMPCINPDGWEYNRTHGGAGSGWRKNRKDNGDGEFGVDLNRNWGVDWGNCNAPISGVASSCGSNNTSSDTYYGTSAFSEPETQAIRNFTYTRQFTAMIDQHSYGPYYSLPFGRPSLPTNTMSAADAEYYTYLSAAMGNYNGMRAGNSLEALNYEVAGGVKDWMLKGNVGTGSKGKVYGMTGEGGAGSNSATFWPPAAQIINLCKGMVFQNIQLLLAAGSYVNLQDRTSINLLSKNGNFDFHVTRVGLKDQSVLVSVVPIENIQASGTPVTIASLPTYGDTYNGSVSYTLPATLINGQRVRFAWKIESGGMTYYDTVTSFYNAQELFYDNMDGGFAQWTGTNGFAQTSAGTGYGGGASRAISESPTGNYGPNSTRTATCNTIFNLNGATAAYISFWVRHRAENFRDKMQLQVSSNGGAWTAIAGTTTVQEPGTLDGSTINGEPSLTGIKEEWTRELFDLSDYLGDASVRFRFEFTSDANSTGFDFQVDDGFYIDELKLVKTSTPLVTLPVKFLQFTGRALDNGTIRLDWSAQTDQLHDYFEVEKSSNGADFFSIGNGVGSGPYSKIDNSPFAGNNYYRIKQVDKDGSITYSSVINVIYNSNRFQLAIFPNPVKDIVKLKFSALVTDWYTIRIADLSGRTIYQKVIQGTGTSQELDVNMAGSASQVYIMTVSNPAKEILIKEKLVKQ